MQSLKVTFIGGGSYQWVPVLFRDIAVHQALQGCVFSMYDIHAERNDELAQACRTIGKKLGSGVQVETAPTLEQALDGAAIVILCISTGGLDAMEHDIEIPKKYGIYQPVGDSTGPGGISRTLRNVPVVVEIAKQMERHCPDAWLLNLSNPMGQIVRAVHETSGIKVVGLCHEFMGFMSKVQRWLGLQDWQQETSASVVGVNHFAWITQLDINGEDGLERLRHFAKEGGLQKRDEGGALVNQSNLLSGDCVKFDLFRAYGAIPYPGDRHIVEFFPHFLSEKTNHGADFGVALTSINDRRTTWLEGFKKRMREWTSGGDDSVPRTPSEESLAPIIASLLFGSLTVQPVTIPNRGQIANLPLGSSVETLATFSRDLMAPHVSGPLPDSLLSLLHKHCVIQDLTVRGAIEGNRDLILQAMIADPLNNNNDYREIDQMLTELLEANRALLPQFFAGA